MIKEKAADPQEQPLIIAELFCQPKCWHFFDRYMGTKVSQTDFQETRNDPCHYTDGQRA